MPLNVKLKVHPVILAGGSGTRLWPMSREQHPKQLIGLLGDDSLLQSTTRRLDGLEAGHLLAEQLVVVANEEQRFTTAEQLRTSGKPTRLILEPAGRDTAPALTVAALSIAAQDEDGIMVVMPADHAVTDIDGFHAAVAAGVQHAAAGHIVTMGIVPTHAETGYGYIRIGAALGTPNDARATDIDAAGKSARTNSIASSKSRIWNSRSVTSNRRNTGGTAAFSSCAHRPG